MSRMTPDPGFEHGVLLGCAVGLLGALGVEVQYEPVKIVAPARATRH
jgi:hypothetical protein